MSFPEGPGPGSSGWRSRKRGIRTIIPAASRWGGGGGAVGGVGGKCVYRAYFRWRFCSTGFIRRCGWRSTTWSIVLNLTVASAIVAQVMVGAKRFRLTLDDGQRVLRGREGEQIAYAEMKRISVENQTVAPGGGRSPVTEVYLEYMRGLRPGRMKVEAVDEQFRRAEAICGVAGGAVGECAGGGGIGGRFRRWRRVPAKVK